MRFNSGGSSARPRVLVLTPRYPYPVIGGDRLRIYEMCKELALECDLTLLSLCDQASEMSAPLPADGVFKNVHRVWLPKWRSYINSALALVTRRPLQVAYYRSETFRKKLEALLPEHDLVLAHLLRTGDYVKDVKIPTVVEMTDAISMNYSRLKAVGKTSGFRSLVYSIERGRLHAYEKSSVHHHELLSFVSSVDAQYLYGSPRPDNVFVCGNGVDTRHLQFGTPDKRAPVVAFIGNMVSLQNQDAALWFATEILPLLRQHGDFKFRIVGQITDKGRSKFAGLPGVEVTGKVDSVANSIRNCFAGVCTVRIGAGVQNKLLEYMALGLPAVTTSVGLEGLGARDDEDLYVADTPHDFCQKLLHLWNDEAEAQRLAVKARQYVESHHTWAALLSPLVYRIKSLASTETV
jgi:glycosyltransferase involved in cell wall biosynthesis